MLHRKALFLAAIILVMAVSSFAESNARIVRLSHVEGDVQLDRLDGRGFSHAFLNMPIVEGMRVWTKSDARAEIEFEDGSTVRLAPDSVMEFQQLRRMGRGERSSMLVLQEGTAYFNIDKDKNDDFRVVFADEHLTFDNKARFRVSLNASEYRLAVFRNDVELLKSSGGRLVVRKNENLVVEFADRDRYFLAKGTPVEAHDYWDREREDAIAEYARRLEQERYDRAYAYGHRDLYQYGTFVSASFGPVWRPHHVGYDWNPYGSGYWVFYRGHGYVFVSSYPWGWSTFRYGTWVHVSNYGWCWRPAQNHNTWVTVYNIHNAPQGYTPPVRPQTPTVVNASVTPVIPVGRPAEGILRGRMRVPVDGPEGRANGSGSGVAPGTANGGGNVNANVVTERSSRPSERGVITNETLPVDPNRLSGDAGSVSSGRGSRTGGNVQSAVTPVVNKPREIDDSSRVDEVRREEPMGVAPTGNPSVSPQPVGGRVERPHMNEVDMGRRQDLREDRPMRTPVQTQPVQPSVQPSAPVVQQQRPVETRVDRPQRTYTPPPQMDRPQRVHTPPPQPTQPAPQVQQSRPSAPPPSAAPARSERVQPQQQRDN